jgi:hypothetical protein
MIRGHKKLNKLKINNSLKTTFPLSNNNNNDRIIKNYI